jgi:LPS-assembly lipoprotein
MQLRTLILTLMLGVMSGCGFHLRSATPLPEVVSKAHVVVPTGSPLRYELESLLLSAGGEVIEDKDGATSVVQVASASIKRRTLSLDALGRAREYGLTLTVKYTLQTPDGEALTEQLIASVERDFRFDPSNVLAKGAEQEMVEEEMYRVAAQQMLRRLRALASAIETVPPVESAPEAVPAPDAEPVPAQ